MEGSVAVRKWVHFVLRNRPAADDISSRVTVRLGGKAESAVWIEVVLSAAKTTLQTTVNRARFGTIAGASAVGHLQKLLAANLSARQLRETGERSQIIMREFSYF